MSYKKVIGLLAGLALLTRLVSAQQSVNKYRIFVGIGDNKPVSDYTSLTDDSFLGEVSGQARAGIRFYDNYELNVAMYKRSFRAIDNNPEKYPGMSYNKLLGYSASLIYEFRNPGSRWGCPFGFEVIKYNRNLDSALNDVNQTVYYDHYDALAFGPKIGVRYHLSKHFFIETELEILYEKFKQDIFWPDKYELEANAFSSFKFFGLSANLAF